MAVTQNTYTGNGSTVLFSFTFPYLETTDIKVSVNGTITTAYTLANATTIQFNTAPANGAAIRIYRQTDDSALSAQFYPGSAIRSQDLNDNFTQNLYVTQEVNSYAWDNEDDTVKSTQTWVSSDSKVATTAALDARFQDEFGETLTSSETWVSNNDLIPTTASVDQRIDTAITNDIGTDGTGITVANDGDGTITLGLAANSIDFDRIKDVDIITTAEQNAGSPAWSDSHLATAGAASTRFDTLVQSTIPVGSSWAVGKTWLQSDQDLTLSVWNGTNWIAVASGGAFINQPKVVYVDATAGDDNNDGHRISRPKQTIKAAVQQINADATYGDGSVVVVAPGVYSEVAPIDITRKDVSIIGTALRSCVVHPTAATETNSLFRVNSGTFLQNLTFTGVKASGARGGAGSVDPNSTYGLPITQGWNVSFYPGAMIYKSPYIQSCTNFSDSEINNANLNPNTPAGGSAGDTDSTVTGGGLLIDGSTVSSSSPLRSMVCDSYTHVGLDGPGILVTNNGYCQATSSYAFFNHYHIKCLNGGQANLAASTTDFGRYGLVADGRSTSAIFTATTTANASNNAITFTIGTPLAGGSWHGSATRPQSNMLVDIGGNTYPILSSTPNGTGWDVTISRPDPSDKAINLGLNGAVNTGATVSFYLRSMIASSGHTMEYVGSGTNYSALPENGGVPNESNQIVELNDGKVWAVTTDHNGKFKLGNFFTVDQQTNSISVATGSLQVDLSTLEVNNSGYAVLGANLDLSGNTISDTTGSVTINDVVSLSGNKITNLADPTLSQDAATKNYVDSNTVASTGDVMTGALGITSGSAAAPSLYISGDTNTGLASPGADELALVTGGTARLTIDASGNVAVPGGLTKGGNNVVTTGDTGTVTSAMLADGTVVDADISGTAAISLSKLATGALPTAITVASANIVDGTIVNADVNASAAIAGTKIDPDFGSQTVETTGVFSAATGAATTPSIAFTGDLNTGIYSPGADQVAISTNGTGRLFVDSSGRVLAGTSTDFGYSAKLQVFNGGFATGSFLANQYAYSWHFIKSRNASTLGTIVQNGDELGNIVWYGDDGTAGLGNAKTAVAIQAYVDAAPASGSMPGRLTFSTTPSGSASPTERLRITSDGKLGLGTSSPGAKLHVGTASETGIWSGFFGNNLAGSVAPPANYGLTFGYNYSNGSGEANIVYGTGTGAGLGLMFASYDGTTYTNRMLLDGNGSVFYGQTSTNVPGVGNTATGSCLSFGVALSISRNGNPPLALNRNTSDGSVALFHRNGTQVGRIDVTTTATSYITSSDYRLKENVVPLNGAAARLNQLQVHRFNFIADPDTTVDGFLAHEAQAVVPECVTGTKDEVDADGNPVYQGIDQSKLVPLLTAALQEALAEIESLKARVTALEP